MIERLGSWIGHHIAQGMAWFDAQSGYLQLVIVVVVALVIVGLTHLDELARERKWRLFRLWLEERRRAGALRLPRGLR